MTRRTVSKIVVILIVVPIAIRAWHKIQADYFSPAETPEMMETQDHPRSTKSEALIDQQDIDHE